MSWDIVYLPEAVADRDKLDGAIKPQVLKGIEKVAGNPLSKSDGGYGDPLGHIGGVNLTGLYKIKFRSIGIRVVYGIERTEETMTIVIIDICQDSRVYAEAERRREKHNL